MGIHEPWEQHSRAEVADRSLGSAGFARPPDPSDPTLVDRDEAVGNRRLRHGHYPG